MTTVETKAAAISLWLARRLELRAAKLRTLAADLQRQGQSKAKRSV